VRVFQKDKVFEQKPSSRAGPLNVNIFKMRYINVRTNGKAK